MGVIYLIAIVLHIILGIVYAYDWYMEYGRLQEAVFRLSICLCIPVFGFLFFHFVDYFYKKNEGHMKEIFIGRDTPLDELSLLRPIDKREEINRVPVEEALQMGEYRYRRNIVMETLKQDDTIEYLEVLKKALENEDRETAHYASAIIMDVQKKVQEELLLKEAAFQREPENREAALALEQELYRLIGSGVYDKQNIQKYYIKYKLVSDMLLENLSGQSDAEDLLHHRIEIDFATEDVAHAQRMCGEYRTLCPSSENMVIDTIKLYVKMKNREALETFLKELREMPVLLTNESLQYIRFFSKER